jgi:hypothetical protein
MALVLLLSLAAIVGSALASETQRREQDQLSSPSRGLASIAPARPRPGGRKLDMGAAFRLPGDANVTAPLEKLERTFGLPEGELDLLMRYQSVAQDFEDTWEAKMGPALRRGAQVS